MVLRGPKPKPLKDRHLASIDKLSNGCWEWNKSRYTQVALGKEYSISNKHVSSIVNRKRWGHI